MKKLRLLIVCSTLLFFTSCFDTIEEFTINEDGSGEYSMKMDMFRMIEMMSEMGGKDNLSKNKDYNEVKDSSFLFKDFINEAENLTAEEKALFHDGRFNMHMNMKEKEMFVNYAFPFKSRGDLSKIYSSGPKALEAIGRKIKPEGEGDAAAEKGSQNTMMPKPGATNDAFKGGEFFDLTHDKGVFSKKAKVAAIKEYAAKDSTLKQMMPMLGSAYSITIVHLPRPAKKVDHPYAKLSEDKKTVTLKFPISDYFERPEVMDFKIEY
ncbi:MAG: hypothetical protein IPN36_18000 [Bacteroidetes bacterium]|nr:hypothetical protein [Bacteroidota bacterium]